MQVVYKAKVVLARSRQAANLPAMPGFWRGLPVLVGYYTNCLITSIVFQFAIRENCGGELWGRTVRENCPGELWQGLSIQVSYYCYVLTFKRNLLNYVLYIGVYTV